VQQYPSLVVQLPEGGLPDAAWRDRASPVPLVACRAGGPAAEVSRAGCDRLQADLAAATPDGIDGYFDNVGGAVLDAVLEGVHERLGAVLHALRGDAPAVTLAELLTAGNAGVARIPGKHGRSAHFAHILVVIDDRPGQLAQLLTDIGELGINMEDLRLEHSPGSAIGFAEVSVLASAEATLVSELEVRGWRIAGEGQ
jgi:prephenate dehydrogenase